MMRNSIKCKSVILLCTLLIIYFCVNIVMYISYYSKLNFHLNQNIK